MRLNTKNISTPGAPRVLRRLDKWSACRPPPAALGNPGILNSGPAPNSGPKSTIFNFTVTEKETTLTLRECRCRPINQSIEDAGAVEVAKEAAEPATAGIITNNAIPVLNMARLGAFFAAIVAINFKFLQIFLVQTSQVTA